MNNQADDTSEKASSKNESSKQAGDEANNRTGGILNAPKLTADNAAYFADMYENKAGTFVPPEGIGDLVSSAKSAMYVSAITGFLAGLPGIIPYVAIAKIAGILFSGQAAQRESDLWWWVATAVICLIVHHLMYMYSLGIAHQAEAVLRGELRFKIMRHMGRLPLGWLSQTNSGSIKVAATDDIAKLHVLVAHIAGDGSHSIGLVVFGAAYLFAVNWVLALVLLGVLFALMFVLGASNFSPSSENVQMFMEGQKRVNATTIEMTDGIQEVKNFGLTGEVFSRFEEARKNFIEMSYTWSMSMKGQAFLMSLLQSAVTLGLVVPVVLICTWFGWAEPWQLVPFALVFVGLPQGMYDVLLISTLLYEATAAADNTLGILQTPRMTMTDNPQDPDIEIVTVSDIPAVEVHNMSFGYNDERAILENINLTMPQNTITALIGPSGGGKTTMARLIARFWDVTEGSVKVFGEDVRDVSQQWLMTNISIVFQDTYLAPVSIAENIALGHEDASQEDIEQAAKDANIHDRIMRMPNGYDTMIGEVGGVLSGGEKQRLTIARAFLANAPILILDEATAQADPRSERLIRESLERLSKNKTVIMIAHRLTTIRDADQIVVIGDGGIQQSGTHDELVEQEGPYRTMLNAQGLLTAEGTKE